MLVVSVCGPPHSTQREGNTETGAALSAGHKGSLPQQLPLGPPSEEIYCCEGLPVITGLKTAIWVLINLYESAHNLTAPRNKLHASATKGSGRGIRKGADMLISGRPQPGSGSFPPTTPSPSTQRNLQLFPIATNSKDC